MVSPPAKECHVSRELASRCPTFERPVPIVSTQTPDPNLTSGTSEVAARLGIALADQYRIVGELGAGGMATVYLAHDLKHDRKVAIKVLKPELAAVLGADRFVVEIKTTASLQHPHILPLFDSGTADGFLFYVMPFIDGETLRAKLDRETQLGIDEAVRIARDVADALEYAHQHGVIHRDIKPENILLHDGRPMVADFGIALAVSAAAGGRMTETGLSLGTPHYMSPEQATAEKEITGRSDVYSLASVLYEMLTGDPPHTGASAQQIIMKIIAEPVQPVTALRKSVPANVAAAVAQALEKLPADRFASARAFSEALASPGFRVFGNSEAAVQAKTTVWRRNFYAAAAVALALAAYAVAVTVRSRGSSPDGPSMHLRLSLLGQRITAPQSDLTANSERPSRTAFLFTPDGKALVFSGERDGHQQLFLRPLSGETATPIPGTEEGESPFLSPNGALGFWAHGRLRRVALSGGPPIDIATVPRISGASWSENDRVVVGAEEVGLIVFSVTGAAPPDTIVKGAASLPQFLPGGKTILFTQRRSYDVGGRQIEAVSLATRVRKVVIDNAEDARFASTGHLMFARDGKMLAVPFDAGKLQVTAAPIVVLDDVMQAQNGNNTGVLTNAMQVAISPVGQLAWLAGGITPDRIAKLEWVDRQGRSKAIGSEGAYFMARLSPDETRAAVFEFGRPARVAIVDLAREDVQSLPAAGHPWILWSRDGTRVVHGGKVKDFTSLVSTLADGSKPAEPIGKGVPLPEAPAFWSTDGAELFTVNDDYQLVGVNVSTGATRVVAGLPAGIMWPTLSPDGKWIAYSALEASGKAYDVFVQPWPALDRRWKVSTAGGIEPAWTRGGRELLYRQPGRSGRDTTTRMMSVDIGLGATLTAGIPRELFATSFLGTNPVRNWDVTANGSRFLIVSATMVHAPPGDVHIIVNWFADLRRLFATGSRP